MEKKEKSAEDKSFLKMKQMNNNMFNFIKTIGNVQVQMPVLNTPDPTNPDKFIPEYEINGTSTTNKEFEFKIQIDPLNDFQVKIYLGNETQLILHNNSQLRFVLENYQVTDKKKKEKPVKE
jgi:hypothetical protein